MGIEHKFPKGLQINAPEGKIITKFHNNIAFISKAKNNELENKAGFTNPQMKEIKELELARIGGQLEYRPLHFYPISIVEFVQNK